MADTGVACVVGVLALLLLQGCAQRECFKPCHIDLYGANGCAGTPDGGPLACTEMYAAGDKCLQYLSCDGCNTVKDPRFDACVSCFRSCTGGFEDCEARCG
ncbi:MAG: hypothetical protein WC350_01945 [Candidatus Micrarchaeia archaeon]|jgi:hypothetical protein